MTQELKEHKKMQDTRASCIFFKATELLNPLP